MVTPSSARGTTYSPFGLIAEVARALVEREPLSGRESLTAIERRRRPSSRRTAQPWPGLPPPVGSPAESSTIGRSCHTATVGPHPAETTVVVGRDDDRHGLGVGLAEQLDTPLGRRVPHVERLTDRAKAHTARRRARSTPSRSRERARPSSADRVRGPRSRGAPRPRPRTAGRVDGDDAGRADVGRLRVHRCRGR